MSAYVVVIPARFESTRLPGKPLLEINGEPMIRHVFERASESAASEIVIATDDERIADAAEGFGASVCMTNDRHRSGTERIAEVCDLLDWPDDRIVVNLQGDEPTMPATLIDQCAGLLAGDEADIATLASPLAAERDFANPNVVKVITDERGFAIYFSRAAIPYARGECSAADAMRAARHHHGIYAYRCSVLRRLVAAEASDIERCEQLEQLRALSLGLRIRVAQPVVRPGPGVDTEAELAEAARRLT